jgi:hypothetical protein
VAWAARACLAPLRLGLPWERLPVPVRRAVPVRLAVLVRLAALVGLAVLVRLVALVRLPPNPARLLGPCPVGPRVRRPRKRLLISTAP